jgi:hypothetical protein
MPELKLDITVPLPGEALLIKLLDVYEQGRASMSDDNRNGWDKLVLAMARGWHNQWVAWGWPGEKV